MLDAAGAPSRNRQAATMSRLRDLLIGPPLPAQRMTDVRLSNLCALAALAPDALSSIAYANQEILLGLVAAGAAGLAFSWSIALAITALLDRRRSFDKVRAIIDVPFYLRD
jgi:hypothetical protein